MSQPLLYNRRMPMGFGPSAGPRWIPPPFVPDPSRSPKTTLAGVNARAERSRLESLLPSGLQLDGDGTFTVEVHVLEEIEWLAGRGYNILALYIPVTYRLGRNEGRGRFVPVMWESLTDPILTGRDELGANKIYAEIPPPRVLSGRTHYSASWLGFRFFSMTLEGLATPGEASPVGSARPKLHDGVVSHKFVPRTGSPGEADADYLTLWPAPTGPVSLEEELRGTGRFAFSRATWEELPTQFHIVNTLADLGDLEFLGAFHARTRGGGNFSDVRILTE